MSVTSFPSKPVLVSWRLYRGEIPLMNRHMKALTQRGVGSALYGWILSQLESTVSKGGFDDPSGVLRIDVNEAGETEFTVTSLPAKPSAEDISIMIDESGTIIDGAFSSVWMRRGDEIVTPAIPPATPRGTRDLAWDLGRTMGYRMHERSFMQQELAAADEAFLLSDVFGVILLEERGGSFSEKLDEGLHKIWG